MSRAELRTCHLFCETVHIVGFIDVPHSIRSDPREFILVTIATFSRLMNRVPLGYTKTFLNDALSCNSDYTIKLDLFFSWGRG